MGQTCGSNYHYYGYKWAKHVDQTTIIMGINGPAKHMEQTTIIMGINGPAKHMEQTTIIMPFLGLVWYTIIIGVNGPNMYHTTIIYGYKCAKHVDHTIIIVGVNGLNIWIILPLL